MFGTVVGDLHRDGVNAAGKVAFPNQSVGGKHTVERGGEHHAERVTFRVNRGRTVKGHHGRTAVVRAVNGKDGVGNFVVQHHRDGVRCVVAYGIKSEHSQCSGGWRLFSGVVKGVREFIWTNPLVTPTRTLAVEINDACEIVTFGVVGSGGVDGDRARLRHDKFAPGVEGGFEINRQHRCEIDQFNRPGFCCAMGDVAHLEGDFVDAV